MLQSIDYNLQPGNVSPDMPPEYQLWLAVIDRAIVDYINPDSKLNAKDKAYTYWFLFETQAEPNNLAYLSDILFDHHGAADEIRGRVIAMKAKIEREEKLLEYRGRYRRKLNRYARKPNRSN